MKKNISFFGVLGLLLLVPYWGFGQKISMKDSLDGAFDVSDYMMTAHGLLVVPSIITEPALGSFGGVIVPVYIKKLPPVIDTINGKQRISHQAPDITGGIGMYTANDSWMGGLFRSGTFQKAKIKYRIFSAYADINMGFYSRKPALADKEFEFNFKGVPFFVSALRQFGNIKWSAGLQYMFLSTTAKIDGDLPDFFTQKERKDIISQIGGQMQYDSRDNIFTPDKGIRIAGDFFWSDKGLGSDYNFWMINYSAIGYTQLTPKLIGGLRIEGSEALGDVPFYQKPFVNLRGVPTMRYQGNATLLTEGELRWDVYRRWSAMLYGGVASAYDEWDEMFDEPLVYNYGTGFRYLIARKFKLRMGIDVAKGPDDWGYYITFGSNWLR